MSSDTYLLDHGWAGERERLAALGALFDPGTFRHLAATGLEAGWRCLEVGGGAGSVATWLCDQVGPTGQVVATDLDIGFLSEIDRLNLVVRRHNIVEDELEEGAFDLVHTRLVLEHLRSRDVALSRMVRALKPGGWLVVEAIQWGPVQVASSTPGNPLVRVAGLLSPLARVIVDVLRPAGIDVNVGHRLPAEFAAAGLVDVTAEGRSVFITAGTPGATVARLSMARAQDLLTSPPGALRGAPAWSPAGVLTRCPPLAGALNRVIDRVAGALDNPGVWTMVPSMVAASGCRPPDVIRP